MHKLRLFLFALLCSAVCPLRGFTQAPSVNAAVAVTSSAQLAKPQTPQEFLVRARQLSDLEAAGIPFHLKASYTATGDAEFTGSGTIEEWWQSKDTWRKEATLGDQREIAISNSGKPMLRSTSLYVPLRLRQATRATLMNFPVDTSATPWKIQHQKLSGVDLTVITAEGNCGTAQGNDRCMTQFYFTPEGLLRIQRDGATGTLYNNFQRFQTLLIPRRVDISTGTVQNLVYLDQQLGGSASERESTVRYCVSARRIAGTSPSCCFRSRIDY